jgi:hypothetical protein
MACSVQGRPKKAEQVKAKVKSMLNFLFDIKGIVYRELTDLAGQAVSSAYCCGDLRRLHENVRRLRPELWRQKIWLLHHENAPFRTSFSPGNFFAKNNMAMVPHPPYFSLFP